MQEKPVAWILCLIFVCWVTLVCLVTLMAASTLVLLRLRVWLLASLHAAE